MLEVSQLSVSYGKHLALDGVSLCVRPGEIVVMLGANGAGKSSCLKALGGMVPHLPGARIALGGRTSPPWRRTRWSRRGWRWCPEDRGIFPELSVRDNLRLGAFAPRAHAREAENLKRVLTLFPRLAERMGQLARTMSGGERQMVAIGRALMSNPDVLLLDEPSLGLSPLVCKELFQALARIKELGVGVLLVEQNARQGLAIAARGYLLENGRIVGEGAAGALQDDPAVRRAYLGGGAGRQGASRGCNAAPPADEWRPRRHGRAAARRPWKTAASAGARSPLHAHRRPPSGSISAGRGSRGAVPPARGEGQPRALPPPLPVARPLAVMSRQPQHGERTAMDQEAIPRERNHVRRRPHDQQRRRQGRRRQPPSTGSTP